LTLIRYFDKYRIMDAPSTVTALAALAQEHRLQLFRFLVQRGAEGAAAGAIATHLGIPASSLSFHLAQLERAGLVIRVRKSRSLIYSANFAAMNALVGYLMENCCGGQNICAPTCEPETVGERPILERNTA
jgi:ArsR family transcriptional regulator, arsenate/arsenite/antimonite-responsive transcriptional repressor